MAVAEGEEQRPVVLGKLMGCVSWVMYAVGVPILLLGLWMSIKGDDGFIPLLISGFLALFPLLLARIMRRYRDVSAWVYSDHVVVKKRRGFFPGTKTSQLDYKDITKVKVSSTATGESLLMDLLFATETYKVYRADRSKVRLPFSGEIDYSLFLDYCKNNGIEIK